MTLIRCCIIATLLVLLSGAPAWADSGFPTPRPSGLTDPPPTSAPVAPPVVEEPTQAPVPVATVAPPVQPVPDTSPVAVTGEQPTHLVNTNQPTVTVPSSTTGQQTGPPSSSGSAGTPPAVTGQTGATDANGTTVPGAAPGAVSQTGVTAPTTDAATSVASLGSDTGDPSASAPMQLSCGKSQHPVSEPFLVAPFHGWATVNSFVDHDYPDYAIDGRIVLANGLTASAGEGQESDFFPSYWSTSLRQYVNYDGHNGYDFGISYQPVYAAAAGTVMYAGWNGSSEFVGYGQMILINHHNGYVTLYGHLSNLEVHKGDHVSAGEEIAISGSTGHSSGPHLHFSIFHDCNLTDPYGWTGSGKDPLRSFDGETAAYLWLPGHDPLILNPPPGWPAFPAGLHLKLPALSTSKRTLPPADRLLLLRLPDPSPASGLTAGPALARTESAITQEGELLTPYLDNLKSRGLITSYEIIPAAAAVWVRGTADAATLEGLPGVASLSGVAPEDLTAAQTGLAHSVLIQLGNQQAPALWPVGFRSALHAWRPVVTAVNRHALVAGYALPGQKVTVSVSRQGNSPAAAEATADPQTGGFVAMLHDQTGNPVAVQPGDRVEAQSGGRQASVKVSAFTLHAHAQWVSGRSRPRSSVPITLIPRGEGAIWQTMSSADDRGMFRVKLPRKLAAGSLAIASSVDAGGDQESAASYVPGMVVDLAASSVMGWLSDNDPSLQVWRHGREMYASKLIPAADGSFRLELTAHGDPVALEPGDAVSVGSQWNRQRAIVPRLGLTLNPGTSRIQLVGPRDSTVRVRWNRPAAGWERALATDGSGRAEAAIPGPRIAVGDSATVELDTDSGDGFVTSQRVRGVVIREHSNRISGETAPGSVVRVRVLAGNRAVLASARLASDPMSGAFVGHLLDAHGKHLRVEPGMLVEIRDAAGRFSVRVPMLQLTADRTARHVRVSAPGQKTASLTWKSPTGDVGQARLTLNEAGLAHEALHSDASRAIVTVGSSSVLFERVLRISSSCGSCRAKTRK